MPINITNEEFLKGIFRDQYQDAHVCGFKCEPNDTSEPGRWKGRKWGRCDANTNWRGCNSFYTVSTFKGDDRRDPMAQQLFVLVVDDVGANGKATVDAWNTEMRKRAGRPIDPTYALETSPGNYHLGYAIAGLDTHAKATAAMAQWMDLVLAVFGKDPGNAGLTRYVRMPIGINNKPEVRKNRKGVPWRCVLHTWSPKLRYRADKFLEAIGMDPAAWVAAEAGGYPMGSILRTGGSASTGATHTDAVDDPTGWGQALHERGLIHQPHKPGAWDIECPFIDEHTDRADTGSAYLGDGCFKCHHGHCEDRRQHEFRAALEELHQGITASAAAHALAPPDDDPGGGQTPDEQEFIEEQGKQAADQKATGGAVSMFRKYVWVVNYGQFYDFTYETLHSLQSINAMLGPHRAFLAAEAGLWAPGDKKKPPLPSESLLEQCIQVRELEYWPGRPAMYQDAKGNVIANRWRPGITPRDDKNNAHWAAFVGLIQQLTGGTADAHGHLDWYMLNWLSKVTADQSVKPGWQWLILSDQGLGKDTLGTIMGSVLGEDNADTIYGSTLSKDFTAWAAKKLVIVTEMATQAHAGRRGGASAYDAVKMFLSSMPKVITVNPKYDKQFKAQNVGAYLMFSNHDIPMLLDPGERRICVIDRRKIREWAAPTWAKFNADVVNNPVALADIAYRLHERWRAMRPADRALLDQHAPDTAHKRSIIRASISPVDAFVEDTMADTDDGVLITAGELKRRYYEDMGRSGPGIRAAIEKLEHAGMFHVFRKDPKGQVRGVEANRNKSVVFALGSDKARKITPRNKLSEGAIRTLHHEQVARQQARELAAFNAEPDAFQNGAGASAGDENVAITPEASDLDPFDYLT